MLDDGRALVAPLLTHHRTTSERAVILRSLPAFSGIDDEAVAMLADSGVDNTYDPGEKLMEEGAPTEHVHIILSGKVTVSRHGKVTTEVGRRGGVGFLTLMGEDSHGVTAVASEPTETLSFSRDVMREACHESFALLRNNLRVSAGFILQARGDLPRKKGSDPDVELGLWRDRPLTLVERVIDIRQGIFRSANLDSILGIARASREVRHVEGDVLWKLGDPSDFSYFVRYGRIRCENAAGDVVMVGGEFALGTMDLVGALPHRYTATCETDVIGFRLDKEPWLAVLESNYDLAMEFLRVLSITLLKSQTKE